MSAVAFELRDGVALLTLENPPVNALSAAVRTGLVAGIDRAEAENADAVLLRAGGRTFSAGADIGEFGQPVVAPTLGEVCNRIEACRLPVVAAIQGPALGGGFELALAAHYRIAARGARMGLPEVALGLLPGAGGTQRLPRLVGASAALELIIAGQPVTAEAAVQQGILDDVIDSDLTEAGLIWASRVASEGLGPRPTRDVTTGVDDPVQFMSEIATWRAALDASTGPATGLIIDCVEAALLLPFEAGLRRERSVFKDLLASERSQGLRHAFRAERAAARLPDDQTGLARQIRRCVVNGGGALGASLAKALLDGGVEAVLVARDDDSLATSIGQIIDAYDRAVARARLTAQERDARMERLRGATSPEAGAGAGLIIHAGPGEADQIGRDLAAIAAAVGGNPILVSARDNDLEAVAQASGRAASVAAMVVHPPLLANPLVEVSVPPNALPDIAPTLFALVRAMGLRAVLAGSAGAGQGLIAARLRGAARQAAEHLLNSGAGPADIDTALRDWGFRLGPFEAEDRQGIAAAQADQARAFSDRDPAAQGNALTAAVLAAGRSGRAARAGWYSYDADGRNAQPAPSVEAMLAASNTASGPPPDAEQIVMLAIAAMANAGAWLVSDDVARRPLDVDVAALSGLGLARARGGPMLAADLIGLARVQQSLQAMAAAHPGSWHVAPMWAELIKNGRHFSDLNEAGTG